MFWNGLTTTVLADCLFELAYQPVHGLRHLFGETISKYKLLKIVDKRFGWGHGIDPVDVPYEDGTLATIYNDANCYLPAVDFEEQVDMMYRAMDYA